MTSKKKKDCESIYSVKCLNYLRNFTTHILLYAILITENYRDTQYNHFCAVF